MLIARVPVGIAMHLLANSGLSSNALVETLDQHMGAKELAWPYAVRVLSGLCALCSNHWQLRARALAPSR